MRVAVCQLPGDAIASWRESLARIESLADAAARQGAELALFPECAWPAYHLGSRAAYDAARAGGLPGAERLIDCAQALARRMRMMICVGFVEEREGRLFNSAALFGSDGALLGVRSKSFLWDFDHNWFTAGDRIEPIDTPRGRVGIMICADARIPEIAATLVTRGAKLILQPTAWVNAGTPERPWNPQPEFLIAARAEEFGVPIASASKWGAEGGTEFVGSSLVCDAGGPVRTQLGTSETAVAAADVRLGSGTMPGSGVSPLERRVLLSSATSDTTALDEVRAEWTRHAKEAARQMRMTLSTEASSVQALSAADAARFAPPRVATLLGARRLLIIGRDVSEGLVRARAAENRVFVAWHRGDGERVRAFDVRGRPLAAPLDVEDPHFDDREALDKRVADRTDIVSGRRPELYEF